MKYESCPAFAGCWRTFLRLDAKALEMVRVGRFSLNEDRDELAVSLRPHSGKHFVHADEGVQGEVVDLQCLQA